MNKTEPCMCWYGPVVLHENHCCFDDPTPIDQITPGTPPPCGHWVDQEERR